MNWTHFGLYFTPAHVALAREEREQPPLDAAWRMLRERAQAGIHEAQWAGLRFRFDGDDEAGEDGVRQLMDYAAAGVKPDMTFIATVQEALIQAHAFEMLRDHPAMTADQQASFLMLATERLAYLNEVQYEPSYVEGLMRAWLNLVTGIMCEDEDLLQYGMNVYEQAVREDIHPQGYMPPAVQVRDGGGLYRQVLAAGTLVMMAEAAALVGANLWDYSFRGVSVQTAVTYLIYYYFFPEKWRWDSDVSNEPLREYGGFLEIAYRQAPSKDLKAILDELRPVYDPCGGGLPTLSHGLPAAHRKRGLFR